MVDLSLKVENKAWGTYKSEKPNEVKKIKSNHNVFSVFDYNPDNDRYKIDNDEVNIRNVAEILQPRKRKRSDERNQQLRKDVDNEEDRRELYYLNEQVNNILINYDDNPIITTKVKVSETLVEPKLNDENVDMTVERQIAEPIIINNIDDKILGEEHNVIKKLK